MRYLLVAACVLIAGLSGCASNMVERSKTLASSATDIEKASICCAGYATFQFEKITIPYESKFDIGKTSPAFSFPNGKSYFRAFELPQRSQPFILEIESRIAGGGFTTSSSWMFYPVLMFLDFQFKPVATIRDLPFQFDSRGWGKYGMSARIQMNGDTSQYKYVVVFTEPQFFSFAFKFRAFGALGSMSIVAPQSDDTAAVPFSYEGRVGLSVFQEKTSP